GYVANTGYEVLPAKEYDAVIHGIVSLGLRAQSYQGQPRPPQVEFKVIFELPEHTREVGEEDKKETVTAVISKKYKVSAKATSNWFKLLKLLLGEEINERNILQYPMSKLLGRTCVVKVT